MVQTQLFTEEGQKKGKIKLKSEIFGQEPNDLLLAQMVRVYLARQAKKTANTKSRGEVNLTGAKWYRQKGTGRARHGAKSAPIFVGGGVAHGPKYHDTELKINKKMKRRALVSALSVKQKEGAIYVIDIEKDFEPKTKKIVSMLKNMEIYGSKILFVHAQEKGLIAAIRNIPTIKQLSVANLSTYPVLSCQKIVFTKKALEELQK